tara:strand:+ start:9025 stop:11715 length:2691 start_codon:yes stop_codon:yes gene_type:complete
LALTRDEKQKLIDMNQKEIEQRLEVNRLSKDQIDYLTKIGKMKQDNLDYMQKSLQASTQLLKIYQDEAKTIKDKTILAGQALEVEKDIQRVAETRLKSGQITLSEYQKIVDVSRKRVLMQEQMLELQDKFLVSQKEGVEAAKKLGGALSSAMGAFQGMDLAGTLGDIGKALQGGAAGVAAFASSLGTGIISTFINDMFNLVVGAYNMENAFMKATGASLEMAQGVTQTYQALNEFGVSMDEANASAQALFNTVTDFTFMSAEQQQVLQQNTAVLANYGVAVQDLATSTQVQTKMFGMSGNALANANNEIFRFSQEIGVAPAQMQADFAAAGASLAKFGADGMQTFKELARLSKITGLEIQKLKQMTDVADTFEGAATQAAKLNAAVGSNMVNAMDLMMATDPAERFNMMRSAITDAGLSFDQMSYYQRIFYADAMGLNDVSELALVLSNRTDLLSGSTQQSAEDYEKLAEESLAVQSIQEAFNAALAENADEIIEMLGGMDVWIARLRNLPQYFEDIIETIYRFGMILAAGALPLGIYGFSLLRTGVKAMKAAAELGTLIGPLGAIAAEMGVAAPATGAAAASMTALGVASAGSAAAAGTHAAAITTLNAALAMLEISLTAIVAISTPYVTAMAAMSQAASATSAVLAGSTKAMWLMVPAILALGGALAMVIYSFSYLVESFKSVEGGTVGAIFGIAAVTGSIIGMAYATTLLTTNPSWYAFLAGLGLMAVISAGIGFGLSSIGSAISDLAGSISQLSNIDENMGALQTMSTAMSQLATASQVPENSIFDKLTSLASVNLEDTISQVERLVAVVNQTQEDEAMAFASAMTAVREAIVTVNAAPAGAAGGTSPAGADTTEVTIDELNATFTLDAAATENFVKGVATQAVADYVRMSQ